MKPAVLLLLLAGLMSAQATLVMLGDSFSDGGTRGNTPLAYGGILSGSVLVNERFSTGQVNVGGYPASPYYFGRFTNGPVWIETAAGLFGQAVDNFAVGGANGNAGHINVKAPFGYVVGNVTVQVPSLIQQAEAYASLKAYSARAAQDIVVIFIGADEYYQKLALGTGPVDPTETINSVRTAMNVTYNAGVRTFVVVDLPQLSAFPFGQASSNANEIDSLVGEHNSQLSELATSFNESNSDAQVYVYSLSNLFQEVISNPTNEVWVEDFTNTTGPAFGGGGDLDATQVAGFTEAVVQQADNYVFWDTVHPSAHFHYVFGLDFEEKLRPELAARHITQAQTGTEVAPSK